MAFFANVMGYFTTHVRNSIIDHFLGNDVGVSSYLYISGMSLL